MLLFISCLFSTVIIHAYYSDASAFHHYITLVTFRDILIHSAVLKARSIDRTVALWGFYYILINYTPLISRHHKGWLLNFPLWVVILWLAKSMRPSLSKPLHIMIRLISLVGSHAFLYEYNSLK